MEKGHLYVIAAPSGAGKTSLVQAIIDSIPNITVSISHTTRPMRSGETNGIDYHFIDIPTFEKMIKNAAFLEYATVFEHFYGTSKDWVNATLAKGIDVILEIDWQGHQQIKKIFPDAISIFILPPSLQSLKNRLETRNQDSADVIAKRLADAKETVSHIKEFDYLIVNDDFALASQQLKAIIEAGRLMTQRQWVKKQNIISALAT